MPPKAVNQAQQGEGRDALAFVLSGCVAAVALLPTRALLDLKLSAAMLAWAALCAGWAWRGKVVDSSALMLDAWRGAVLTLCVWALGMQGLHRIPGSFGNAGYFAAFLVLSWPLYLSLPKLERNLALTLLAATLLATGSRAALVALAVQGVELARRRPAWRAAIAAALGAVLLGALVWLGKDGLLRPTLRGELWSQTLRLALQHPWLGWGMDPFVVLTEGRWTGALAQSLAANGQFAEHPHQLLLNVFFHRGLLGLALLMAALAALRYALGRCGEAGALLWLGVLGLIAQAQFDRFFFDAVLLTPPLLFLAQRAPLQLPPLRRLMIAAVAAMAAMQAWRPIQAWREGVASAETAGLPAASAALPSAGPQDPAHWDQQGTALAAKGDFHGAEGAFRQALSLQPSAARAINLGNCQMMEGRYGDAEGSFRQAVALDAKNADAQFSLGYALFEQKRLKDALSALDEALRLKPGHAEASKLKEQILK
jgi:tetratricopeptide (TPR) repeat protein